MQDRLDTLFDQQPLGVLLESGAANFLDGWHPTLPLYGVSWQQRWMNEGTAMDAFEMWRVDARQMEGQTNQNKLVVTHCPLFPPGKEFELEYVPTSGPGSIADAMGNAGYIYYGHIHDYHGTFVAGGVTYANMGAISRGSLTEENMNREIKVAMWSDGSDLEVPPGGTSIPAGFKRGFTEIPVPHKPASEVFRVAEVMAERTEKLKLDEFLTQVSSTTLDISSSASVISYVREMDENVVTPRQKQLAIEIVEEIT